MFLCTTWYVMENRRYVMFWWISVIGKFRTTLWQAVYSINPSISWPEILKVACRFINLEQRILFSMLFFMEAFVFSMFYELYLESFRASSRGGVRVFFTLLPT